MSGRSSKRKSRKSGLRLKIFYIFILYLLSAAAVAYVLLFYAARKHVNSIIRSDLQQVLETVAANVDAGVLLDLAATGEPNADGFSDDPRFLALLDDLDAIHQVEPDAWPYLYLPGESPTEIIFVADLISRYEPERSAGFLEAYQSNSDFVLIGLEEQTFREVDAHLIQILRRWADHVEWSWLKNNMHALADGLANSGLFLKQDFGIYEDQYGRWASGYMPIKNATREKAAAVGVDFKAELIEKEYLRSSQLILGMLVISASIPILLLVSLFRRMVTPLDELTKIATNIQQDVPAADKSFANLSNKRTVDEIVILAEVLEGMVKQIRQRERRYQAVINTQQEIILRINPDGEITFKNPAYDKILGQYEVTNLANITNWSMHENDRAGVLRFIEEEIPQISVEDTTKTHEMRIYDNNQELRTFLWSVTGIFNEKEELTEFQGVGKDITELKDIQRQLEKANSRLREISHELFNAAEQERSRLSREVHDDMLNYISELVLNLEENVPARAVNHTYQIIADRLRETIYNLRPPMLAYGLGYGLKDYVHTLTQRVEGVACVHLDLKDDGISYPKEVDIHLFRIVQQACENAVEHANPKNIRISGELMPDQIRLVVEDDGTGFNWDSEAFIDDSILQNHFGLAAMFERSLIVGADVQIFSEEGVGTRIEITLREEEYHRVTAGTQEEEVIYVQ